MKHGLFLCFLLLFLTGTQVLSQDSVNFTHWTNGTAYNVPKHRLEINFFELSSFGISKKVELSAHPLMFWILPQVKVKLAWGEYSGFRLATEHEFTYPTWFLKLVQGKGTGGLISPEFSIPAMFSVSDAFLASYKPFRNALLTAKAGLIFSVKFGPLDPSSTIDLPVIYPWMAVYYDNIELDFAVDFRGKIYKGFGWIETFECYVLPTSEENFFYDNRGTATWTNKKSRFRFQAGYRLTYGVYPSGPQWHLLPVLEISFSNRK
jgi:hypothetical protein